MRADQEEQNRMVWSSSSLIDAIGVHLSVFSESSSQFMSFHGNVLSLLTRHSDHSEQTFLVTCCRPRVTAVGEWRLCSSDDCHAQEWRLPCSRVTTFMFKSDVVLIKEASLSKTKGMLKVGWLRPVRSEFHLGE